MTAHLCHAHACAVHVAPAMLMCRRHWYRLRKVTREAILREYRPGQERDKRPSARYMAVQRLAVAESAFVPHDDDAAATAARYLAEAERWRQIALEAGQGDALEGLVP